MVKKINILLVLLLLIVSVGVVNAADDVNETVSSDEAIVDDTSDVLTSEEVLTSTPHSITNENYNAYFNDGGDLISQDVNDGDTLEISESFSNKNFTFQKSINVVGKENTRLDNCVFTFSGSASGSSISNLNIFNTRATSYGIFLNGVSNCVIQGCFINNTGASSYAVCVANNANYNNVTNNNLHTYGITYGHGSRSTSPLLISGAHHNYIANNNISCWDANGIYLSSYVGGPLKGGASTFNNIYNNTIKYNVLPTSWSYGIQVMGGNNIVNSNTVIGAYRGISTSGPNNKIINNKIINLTGADYNNPNEESGGEIAIVGSVYSIVINNTVLNAKLQATGAGISVLDHSIVENNVVEITNRGTGIHPQGLNITIKYNNISTAVGAGILYNTHSYNLLIIGNEIISQSGVGVLIQKLSSKRMPGNITIRDNFISTGNKYAIDARDADKNSINDISADGNSIPKNRGIVATPEGEFNPNKPVYRFNGKKYTITSSNYDEYFNSDGSLNSNISDGDILFFEGDFSNRIIFVNAAVKITGNNPVFYNTTFRLTSGGVLIENITIINKKASILNAWGVVIYKIEGARVSNCTISVDDPNAAYAIYVVESSEIDIWNNRLYSSGNYLTYTLLAHTVEDCTFENNTIQTLGTGEVYAFETEKCFDGDDNCLDGDTLVIGENCFDGDCLDGNCLDGNHVVQEVYRTYGILMVYSSNTLVSGNNVTVTSKLNQTYNTTTSTNSIVGIDLYYNSHNNIFSKNNVYVYGKDNYIYGMGVLGFYTGHDAPEGQGASNNQFINNNISLNGTYCVEGIIIGDESENTTIISNIVEAKSDSVAYGINLEMSQESNIYKNKFTLNSQAIYGIEVYASDDNIINENNFVLNAKEVYGFLLVNAKNNEINSNVIFGNGTGDEILFKNFDSIECGNAGLYLKSNSSYNNIKENNVTSKIGYAVVLDSEAIDNVIIYNYLDSEEGIGNDAISGSSNNQVRDNYKYLPQAVLSELNIKYLENGSLILTANSDLEGAVVEFSIVDEYVGSAIVIDGKANITYDLKDYTPAAYSISAKLSKENYKTTEFYSTLSVVNGELSLEVENVTGAIARNADFTAYLKNILNEGVSGIVGEFYVLDDGWPTYIGKATSDKDGKLTLVGVIPQIYEDDPMVRIVINNPDYFESISGNASLTAYKLTSTSIQINSNIYPGGVIGVLKDEKGNPIPNIKVNMVIDGRSYDVNTDVSGSIILPILSKGSHSVAISFEGDDQYYSSKSTSKVSVLPSLSENKDVSVYYGSTVNYKVRVKGSDGNYASGKLVIIKVDGKTYNVYTDKNGYATKSLKLKVGSYTVTAEYNGDVAVNKITFKPTLTAKNIVKKKAKKIKFSVKVVNKNGKAVKKKKITFKIKNKKYTAKTNKKGVATVYIKNLKVGKFTITSSYGGCAIKNTIKIKK